MPFPVKQRYLVPFHIPVHEIEDGVNENGKYVHKLVNQSEKVMPDIELFRLENQLDAGVDLEEVNSKVFKTKSVTEDSIVRKYTKKKGEKVNEGE